MSRGILYYMWGNDPKQKKLLERSIESAKKFGYDYDVVWDNSEYKGFRKRIDLYYKSSFDTTLYLDADTVIMDNIDYGFEMAEKYGLACCIAPASSAYDALKQHKNDLITKMPVDLPQYNCGVLFFSERKRAEMIFEYWSILLTKYIESSENDQPYLAYAMHDLNFHPYVLPKNWNYRPHLRYTGALHGNVKILHSN
jgi:lipopolysaccharide biosynthesis glycosyltransferase